MLSNIISLPALRCSYLVLLCFEQQLELVRRCHGSSQDTITLLFLYVVNYIGKKARQININVIFPSTYSCSRWLLFSGFSTKILYSFFVSCVLHVLPFLSSDFITQIIHGEKYKAFFFIMLLPVRSLFLFLSVPSSSYFLSDR